MTPAGRVLAGAGIVAGMIVAAPFLVLATGAYKTMYMPAESMAPTFDVGDKFVARMSRPSALHRGDIVIVDNGAGSLYVKRIAGLPGDRIALHRGIVNLNGRDVPQRRIGEERIGHGETARRLAEQFPGEAAPHELFDTGDSIGDEMEAQTVAPGHLFLLGDNRDRSADSRFARAEHGLEQVSLEAVRGVPSFFYWTTGTHRIGDRASH